MRRPPDGFKQALLWVYSILFIRRGDRMQSKPTATMNSSIQRILLQGIKLNYIQYTGDPPYICPYGGGRYVYPVAVRNGSVYSPPVFYTVLYASNGHWSAQYEAFTRHYGTPLWESSGTAYWGLPYTDLGYGMHWYNQPTGQWNTWTSAPGCNAYTSDAIYTGAVDRVCSAFEGYKR